jgi:hypothetical protein
MWSKKFWQATVERIVRTAAVVLGGFVVPGQLGDYAVNWHRALTVTGYASLGTLLLCLAAGKLTGTDGPAFQAEALTAPTPEGD